MAINLIDNSVLTGILQILFAENYAGLSKLTVIHIGLSRKKIVTVIKDLQS